MIFDLRSYVDLDGVIRYLQTKKINFGIVGKTSYAVYDYSVDG